MAKGRVNKSDVVEDNLFDNLKESAKNAAAEVKLLETSMTALVEIAKQIKGGLGKTKVVDVKSMKEANKLTKEAEQLANSKIKLTKQLTDATDKEVKAKLRLQKATQDQRKALKDEILLGDKQLNTLEKLRARNSQLKRAKDQVNISTKKGQARVKLINAELNRNNKILDKNASKLGKLKNNIGNYRSALGSLTGVLAKLGLGFGVFQILKDSFNTVKEFEQSQANLASVLGVNINQMGKLTAQAKELGATTTFTAQNVLELQKEFAKLGFTEKEIINVTEATLLLAEATGTDLARAAEVTGATIRGFGLDSKETQRVVDVMAKSFSASSLDMEKFSTAMAAVAPIAKTMGFSIEETTAMLGTLTDSGLDASTAGTSLRNMMLEAKKAGLTWTEALDKVNNSQDKASTSLELFGKRGVAAGVILAENQKKVAGLTEKLLDADGAAKQMAETQRNTLGGSIELLKSAWDGIVLSMNEAGGAGDKLRTVIVFLADNLETIVKWVGRAVKAFILYKTALIGLKLAEKIRDQIAFNKAVKSGAVSSTQASKGIKDFGRNLKAIGWAVAIGALLKLAASFWSAVSGANALIRASEKMKGAISGATESANFFLDKLNKAQEKRINDLENERKLNHLTESEFLKQKQEAIDITKKQLEGAIESVEKRRRANTHLWVEQRKQLKDLGEGTTGFELNLSSAELADAWGVNTILPAAKQKILDLVKAQETLKARIEAGVEKIKIYTQAMGETGEASKDAAVDAEAYNNELEDTSKKAKEATKELKDLTDEILRQAEVEKQMLSERSEFEIDSAQRRVDEVLKIEEERAKRTGEVNIDIVNRAIAEEERLRKARIESDYLEALDSATSAIDVELAEQQRTQALIRLDEEITDKKKASLDTLNMAQEEYSAKILDRNKKTGDSLADQDKESFERRRKIIDALTEYAIKRADERIEKLDEEISAAQSQADYFAELAAQGNIEATQSLAEQNQIIAEANDQKRQEEERKQNILKISAFLQAYNSNLEGGMDSTEAFSRAAVDMALVNSFIADIPAFLEGIEDTGVQGMGVDGKGGFHAILHPNERVLTKEQNAKVGDYSNEELARVAENHRLGRVMEGSQIVITSTDAVLIDKLGLVGEKLDAVRKTIQDKPELDFSVGDLTQYALKIVETRRRGNRVTTSAFKVET